MTKKDYIKLAKAIKDNTETQPLYEGLISANPFIDELCDILKQDNPNFDKQRFMEACK